jgi:hypothetical protein
MFDEADAFVALPGGIGTLEEVVELLSWRRLELHRKPIVFLNAGGFWNPLFGFLDQVVALNMAPAGLPATWRSVDTVDAILPAVREMAAMAPADIPRLMPRVV